MWQAHWTMDLQEAEILSGLLKSEGLDPFVFNAGVTRMLWTRSLAFGGYRVMVPAAQARQANELVTAWRNGEMALADETDTTFGCPRCHSEQTSSDEQRRGWAFVLSFIVGLPMPWRWSHWRACHQCKYRWPLNRGTAP
jgi:RNA polymerase subunit RPABC4/transcription elongation factor Spt4